MAKNDNTYSFLDDRGLEVLGEYRIDDVIYDLQGLPAHITISTATAHTSTLWVKKTLTLGEFVKRMRTHSIGSKQGSSWTSGTFRNGKRKNANAEEIGLIVFDSDHGASLDYIISRLKEKGWAALIISTYSDGIRIKKVPKKVWDKQPQNMTPERFLLNLKYSKVVAKDAKISPRSTKEIIYITHNPCPKFRIILFPRRPWKQGDYQNFAEATMVYKAGLVKIANELKVTIDMAAIDLARLFYDPRHPKGQIPESHWVHGKPVEGVWESSVLAETGINSVPDTFLDNLQTKTFETFEELESVVMKIVNDHNFTYEHFFNVGAAIHFETGGSERGLVLFERWASSWESGEHNPNETKRIWKALEVPHVGK